jgi:hypothetical protein
VASSGPARPDAPDHRGRPLPCHAPFDAPEPKDSIGNLVLHLCGNARQWIVAGVSGAADTRDRAREFAQRDPIGRAGLAGLIERTLGEVDARLADLEAAVIAAEADTPLQRACVPQGFAQTVLDAVFHVVEHFSYHTGQIRPSRQVARRRAHPSVRRGPAEPGILSRAESTHDDEPRGWPTSRAARPSTAGASRRAAP